MTDLSKRTKYGRLARIYDWCARMGSLGAIPFVKQLHLLDVEPCSSILYVGGGTCEEAILAAVNGHHVTVLDSSEEMLEIVKSRARQARVEDRVTLLHRDFLTYSSTTPYQAVALHFFLDIFDLPTMHQVLLKSSNLLAPNGTIYVADFAHRNGPLYVRFLQLCYHQGGALACALLAKQPWLKIENYAAECRSLGMTIKRDRHIGPRYFGKSWFIYLCIKPLE